MRPVFVSTGMFMEIALGKFLFGDWQGGKVHAVWLYRGSGNPHSIVPCDTGNLPVVAACTWSRAAPAKTPSRTDSRQGSPSLCCYGKHQVVVVQSEVAASAAHGYCDEAQMRFSCTYRPRSTARDNRNFP